MRTVIVETNSPQKYQELQELDEDEIDIFVEVGRINNILNFDNITVQERVELEGLLRNSGYEPVYFDCDYDY